MMYYLAAGVALLVYLAMAWVMGGMLHLTRGNFYVLFAILAVLGIAGTAIFLWFRSRKEASSAAAR
jgi:FtsH-binding integral membrane protein